MGWSFTVVYSVLARWLGLGSAPEAAGEGDWEQILSDLSQMVTAFLSRPAPELRSLILIQPQGRLPAHGRGDPGRNGGRLPLLRSARSVR